MATVWGRRRHAEPVSEPTGSRTTRLIIEQARHAEAAQERLAASLDQASGVVIGFAGLIVTVLIGRTDFASWLAAGLAGIAAIIAVAALFRSTTLTIGLQELIDGYGSAPDAVVEATILGTSAALVDQRASDLKGKRWRLRAAAVFLVLAVGAVVGGVMVEALAALNDDSRAEVRADEVQEQC